MIRLLRMITAMALISIFAFLQSPVQAQTDQQGTVQLTPTQTYCAPAGPLVVDGRYTLNMGTATLVTTWRVVNPPELRTGDHYQSQAVSAGEGIFTITATWPGYQGPDTLVEVTAGASLVGQNGQVLDSHSSDFFCNPSYPGITPPVTATTTVPTATPVPSQTPSPTATLTPTPSITATPIPSSTPTQTSTPTAVSSSTPTPETSATPSPSPSATPKSSATPSLTPTPSLTVTPSATPTSSPTPSPTPSPSPTPTRTPPPKKSATPTPTPPSLTTTPSPSPTPNRASSPTPTSTQNVSEGNTGAGYQDGLYPGPEIGWVILNDHPFTLYQGGDYNHDGSLDIPAQGLVLYNGHLRGHIIEGGQWLSADFQPGNALILHLNLTHTTTHWVLGPRQDHSYDISLSAPHSGLDIASCYSDQLGWAGIQDYPLLPQQP